MQDAFVWDHGARWPDHGTAGHRNRAEVLVPSAGAAAHTAGQTVSPTREGLPRTTPLRPSSKRGRTPLRGPNSGQRRSLGTLTGKGQEGALPWCVPSRVTGTEAETDGAASLRLVPLANSLHASHLRVRNAPALGELTPP